MAQSCHCQVSPLCVMQMVLVFRAVRILGLRIKDCGPGLRGPSTKVPGRKNSDT